MPSDLGCDWVSYHAQRTPDEEALLSVDDGWSITWRELDVRVARLSSVLAGQCGVERGDRVVVLSESDPRVFELQFACMRIGAIIAPLNWRLVHADLGALVDHAKPAVIVYDHAVADTAAALAAARNIPTMAWNTAGSWLDYERAIADAPAYAEIADHTLDEPTHILYTSGSTGQPKGVSLCRRTMIWNLLNIQSDKRVNHTSRMYNPLPLFHGGGLTALANPILLAGGSLAIARRFDPEQTVRLLGDPAQRITHFTGVLTIYQMLMDSSGWKTADFSGVRFMEFAGGRLPRHVFDAFAAKGVTLQAVYGATETGPAVMQMPVADAARKLGSIGRAVQHTRVRLVGDEGKEVAPGEIGEIWVSGPSVTDGYWASPEANAESFEGRWFRTGDAAYRDDEGFYFVVDRFKNMYKSGGENVYPAEVEAVLIEHPNITELAIIGVADQKWGETGLAVVVTRDGADMTIESILQFCRNRVAKFKLPTRVVTVPSIPHHDSGKRDLQWVERTFGNVGA
ncbi:class I adenylate-forming enzyme family protein [Streptomyces sp. NPDC055722]